MDRSDRKRKERDDIPSLSESLLGPSSTRKKMLVDEADSILIDEARTPLIASRRARMTKSSNNADGFFSNTLTLVTSI